MRTGAPGQALAKCRCQQANDDVDARRSPLFVRPNLKLFVLAGLLILVLTELIQPGRSEVTVWRVNGRERPSAAVLEERVQRLTDQVRLHPSAALCVQIAECHRQLRNYKEAMRWLRRAEVFGFSEDDNG
jgi:hypothetical protein